jgi:hypothetical protein
MIFSLPNQVGSTQYSLSRTSNFTLSDYPTARPARWEAGIQCHGREIYIHSWILAIPAGMTILEKGIF